MMNINYKFKKIFILFLVLGCLFSLTSCKEEQDDPIDEPLPIELNTNYTDELKFNGDYLGKSFINDGIGEVTLSQNVDGDTAHFYDSVSNTRFTARFLCVNTPESTGRIEPWGKEASAFTANILSNATSIVLEAEKINTKAETDTTAKRYLAYVWYKTTANSDWRLLNLELVEECYSNYTGVVSEQKYGRVFEDAFLKSYETKRRKFGEADPNHDYSAEVKEITIAELRNNFEDYSSGTKLKITARVIRLVGDNLYLEDINETWDEVNQEYEYAGIYMFSGYGSNLGSLKIGQVISMQCQAVDNEIYGKQLTNPSKVKIVESESSFTVRTFSGEEEIKLSELEGFVIKVEDYTVTRIGASDTEGAFTIYGVTKNNQAINIRIDGAVYPKLSASSIEVGGTYTVIGGVSKFNDTFQIMLGNQRNEGLNDFLKNN